MAAGILVDGGQPKDLAEFVPVHADHGEILWHAQAEVAGGEDSADGHLIGGGKNCSGPLGRGGQEVPGNRIGTLDGEVRGHHPFGADSMPRSLHGCLEAGQAYPREFEVLVQFSLAGDVCDPGVTESEEMLGGRPGESGVINSDGGRTCQRAADAHDRTVDCQELFDFGLAQDQCYSDDRVQPLTEQEVVQDAAAAFRLVTNVVQGEVVAGVEESGRHPIHH